MSSFVRSAPFRQCQFHVKAQRRCQRPAPRSDKKDSYCAEHARRALMERQRAGRKRQHAAAAAGGAALGSLHPHPAAPEAPAMAGARRRLEELSHHKRPRMMAGAEVKTESKVGIASGMATPSSPAAQAPALAQVRYFQRFRQK